MAPFYTVAVTSSTGASIQFLTPAGADAALFTFESSNVNTANAGGTLRFSAFPDFENPADANHDNVYEYQFRATDGATVATLNLQITVTNVTGGFRVREVYANPTNTPGQICPCSQALNGGAEVPDGSGRLAVVENGGLIKYVNPGTGAAAATPLLDVGSEVFSSAGTPGLLGLAYSPNFTTDRTIYVYLRNATAHAVEVRRYQVFAANRDQVDPSTKDVILTYSIANLVSTGVDQLQNGVITPVFVDGEASPGLFTFDKSGLLLVGTGDGSLSSGGGAPSADADPALTAQNTNSLLGKVLRIDVSSDAFPADPNRDYAIPSGNAYPGGAGGLPEIWALGLHRPYGSVDRTTGDVLINDSGYQTTSEINRIPAGTLGPINFGWSQREGTRFFRGPDSPSYTAPVGEVLPTPGQAAGIGAGIVYRGLATLLQDQYVFTAPDGVKTVTATSLVPGTTLTGGAYTDRSNDFYSANAFIGFGTVAQAATGDVYLINSVGRVYKIEAAD
jgi:hypothetical protein